MEARGLLLALLAIVGFYLVYLIIVARWKRLPVAGALATASAPCAIAGTMAYIFLIKGGSTVAQFTANSEQGRSMWSMWYELWPLLLLVAALSIIGHLVWLPLLVTKHCRREWAWCAIPGLLVSFVAFVTVGSNFPDA